MTTAFKERNLLAVIGDEVSRVIRVAIRLPEHGCARVGHYYGSVARWHRPGRPREEELSGS